MIVFRKTASRTALLTMLLAGLMLLSACGRASTSAPPTATPMPPTATPAPTATPRPEAGSTGERAAPTPEVTIPRDFEPVADEERGYSLALPSGWSIIDLRGENVQRMAGTFGLADQLEPLNDFLDSPEGDAVGVVAATDLAGVLFGGLPTILNVSVINAPGETPDTVMALLEESIGANDALLSDVSIEKMEATTVNKLPAIVVDATIDLSSVGMDGELYTKFTGLIANDTVYLLSLATDAGKRSKKETDFDAIIGTFRPE